MSSGSKGSQCANNKTKTLFQFDRGSIQILNYFSNLTRLEVISLQLVFFSLLEILSLNLTDNDPIKSDLLSQALLNLFEKSKILPTSMCLSAKSVRQSEPLRNYVRILQSIIQTALTSTHRRSKSSDRATITKLLPSDFKNILLSSNTSSNITIDIPQQDIQLKVPLPFTMKGALAINDFDNIVIFRYIQDFFEHAKIGKGGFGSVFCAKNRLDDRMYAVKKIVFNGNTNRTRRQAQLALREVRVLAALSHPNIVQYHCAWLELVPIATRVNRTSSSSSSSPSSPQIKESRSEAKPIDSIDEFIQFEGQSLSSIQYGKEKNEMKSPQKSSATSTDADDDDNEVSVLGTIKYSDACSPSQHNSNGDSPSLFSTNSNLRNSRSRCDRILNESKLNRELIPIHTQNQVMNSIAQSNYSNSKIVLFIQMQLCDATLHDWLRYRDLAIIQESSHERKNMFYSLNDLGQRQCWHIFKQLLVAVQYLHSQSFVHRDIKPRNIFLAYDSKDNSYIHVKLGDFGLATLLDSESSADSYEEFKFDESFRVGTALYAPPEQLNSRHCIATAKSDSYSLGIVLFELFNVFGTEMERSSCISHLRAHMKVEDQFSECYPCETNIIEQLVLIDSDKRLSVEELLTIYEKEIQKKITKQKSNAKQMIIEQLQEKLRVQDRRIKQLELEIEKINHD